MDPSECCTSLEDLTLSLDAHDLCQTVAGQCPEISRCGNPVGQKMISICYRINDRLTDEQMDFQMWMDLVDPSFSLSCKV